MYTMWIMIILLGFTARVAYGFGSGAPAARCGNMIPAHRSGPNQIPSQQTPLPYNFQMSTHTYSPGEPITMRLTGQQAGYFKGFLIKVVTDQGEAVGVMTAPRGYMTVQCGPNGDEALTHTEKSQKQGVMFTWTAPLTSRGTLSVRATVVYNYGTFWVDEVLATMEPADSILPQITTPVSPQLTPAPVLTTISQTTKQPELITHTKVISSRKLANVYNEYDILNTSIVAGKDSLLIHNETTNPLGDGKSSLKGNMSFLAISNNNISTNPIHDIAASLMLSQISNIANDYYAFTQPLKNTSAVNKTHVSSNSSVGAFFSISDKTKRPDDTETAKQRDKTKINAFKNISALQTSPHAYTTVNLNLTTIQPDPVNTQTFSLDYARRITQSLPQHIYHSRIFDIDTTVSNSNMSALTRTRPPLNVSIKRNGGSFEKTEEKPQNLSASVMNTTEASAKHASQTVSQISRLSALQPDIFVASRSRTTSLFPTSFPTLETINGKEQSTYTTVLNTTAQPVNISTSLPLLEELHTHQVSPVQESNTDHVSGTTTEESDVVQSKEKTSVDNQSLVTENTPHSLFTRLNNETNMSGYNKSGYPMSISHYNHTTTFLSIRERKETDTSSAGNNLDTDTTIEINGMKGSSKATKGKDKITTAVDFSKVTKDTGKTTTVEYTINLRDKTTVHRTTTTKILDRDGEQLKEATSLSLAVNNRESIRPIVTITPFSTEKEDTNETAVTTLPVSLFEMGNTESTVVRLPVLNDHKETVKTTMVADTDLGRELHSTPNYEGTSTTIKGFSTDVLSLPIFTTETTTVTTLPPIVARTLRPTKRRMFWPLTTDVWLNMKPVPVTVNNLFKLMPTTKGVWLKLEPTFRPPIFIQPVFKAPRLPVVTSTAQELSTVETTTKQIVKTVSAARQDGVIEYDPACGFSKGCFVDCDGNGCRFMVTWQDVGYGVIFELYAKPRHSESWIAIGLSKDSRMGDDGVTECIHSGGVVQAFNSYNPTSQNERLVQNAEVGLTGVSGSYFNGVFTCRFTRAYRVAGESRIFDLQQDWHLMLAHGQLVPGSLAKNVHTDTPVASASRIDYQSVVVVGKAAKFTLVKVHGCLMIMAWVLFTGVGICVARYYKNVWSDKTFLKLKIWFQVHRSCMVTALILDLIAFIIIFVDVKGYSQIPDIPGKFYLKSHPVLGIIVTLLCVANPIMALFRPGPNDAKRSIFNWAHWGVGISAYILSALTICFGFELGKASTPDYAVYIMIGYIVYIVLFDVACEVHDYITKKEKKSKAEPMEMSTHNGTDNGIPNGTSTNYSSKDKTKKSDKLKTILLAFHIAFTGAFALVLVLVVALN